VVTDALDENLQCMASAEHRLQKMYQFNPEMPHIDTLRHDQPQVEWHLIQRLAQISRGRGQGAKARRWRLRGHDGRT
jgi:hypothetical protein